jgi:hypothetical protein
MTVARRTFDLGSGRGPFTTFEQCQNAIRAQRINEFLDAGHRVFGDDGPDKEGVWHEIDEAVRPHANGIECRTKAGAVVRIYSYDASDGAAKARGFAA